jgi:hypothetical protein
VARFLRTDTNSSGGHSRLRPPIVVDPPRAFHGPGTRLVQPLSRNDKPYRRTMSRLRPPTVLATPPLSRPIKVVLAPSTDKGKRREAKYSLPQLLPVNPADNFGGPRVKLVAPRSRRPPTVSRLRPPTVVLQDTATKIRGYLTPPRATNPPVHSRLRPGIVSTSTFTPCAEVTDNFTRANEDPIRGIWAASSTAKLASNTLQPATAGGTAALRQAVNPLGAWQMEITMAAIGGLGTSLLQFGISRAVGGLQRVFAQVAPDGQMVLRVFGSSVATTTRTISAGDRFALVATPAGANTTYEVFHKPVASPSFTLVMSSTNSLITWATEPPVTPFIFTGDESAPFTVSSFSFCPYTNDGPSVAVAYSRRGRAKSRLRPPAVVTQVLAVRPIQVELAYSRRGKAKSRLLPVPAAFRPVGFLNVNLAYSRRGVPKSRLRRPTDVVDAQDLGYLRTHLAYSRRGVPKSSLHNYVVEAVVHRPAVGRLTPPRSTNPPVFSSLPKVIYEPQAQIYDPIQGYLVPPRSTRPPIDSRLPKVIYDAAIYEPIRGYLTNRERLPSVRSHLSPPAVAAATYIFGGPHVRLVNVRDRNPKTIARLLPVPSAFRPVGKLAVHLAYSRRGTPKSRLEPPTVVEAAFVYGGPKVRIVRSHRPAPVHSFLRRPTDLVDAADLGYLRTHLAYSRRGKPRSRLFPPVVVAPVLARPIRVKLARIRPAAVHSILRKPTDLVDAADLGRVKITLVRIRPPRTMAVLTKPVVILQSYGPLGGILTQLAPQRRGTPKSRLFPPTTLIITYPAVQPSSINLAYSRRGVAKSKLPTVVYPGRVYRAIKGSLTPPRATNPHTISHLQPPAVVNQPVVLYPISVTLAYSRRGAPKSRLLVVPAAFRPVGFIAVHLAYSRRGVPKSRLEPPTVVFPFIARPTVVELVRIKPPPVHSILRRPIDVVDQQDLGYLRTHLAYSRRGVPKSRLEPPTVVFPFFARPTQITLARILPPPVHSILRKPTDIVDQADVGYLRVHLAYSLRGAPKSILHPPVPPETFRGIQVHLAPSFRGKPKSFFVKTPIAYLAVEIYGPELHLVRIRPPRTMAVLGPMGPPAVVYAPISATLTYSRRGAPKSKLPQASLYQPVAKAEYDLRITLAPQRRGKPKSFLRPPQVVLAAKAYFRREPVTLVRIRPRRTLGILRRPVVVLVFYAEPIRVHLAPQRRGVPKSFLGNHIVEARVYAPIRVTLAPSTRLARRAHSRLAPPTVVAPVLARPTAIHLAPSFRGTPKSKLEPPTVVNYPPVESTLRVYLAPSSRGKPKSALLPPAVVARFEDFGSIQTTLVRITPPPVHSRLRPPAVIGAGIAFFGPRVTLVRIRPQPTTYLLRFPNGLIIPCYGEVCGIDYAAVVCGEDYAAEVTGDDSPGAKVTGSDSAAEVTGESGARGNVSGGDERREGC